MVQFAGACRFIFNRALALQKERREREEKKLSYFDLCRMLTDWRKEPETPWLKEMPVDPLRMAFKHLERAYGGFFAKRSGFPKFKKKGQRDCFVFCGKGKVKISQDKDTVWLPKIGWVRYRNSREVLGIIKNAAVSRSCGKWYVSIQTEREVEQLAHPSASIVGVDVGIARFATLSDGTVFEPVSSFKKHQARLARYQRAMSRKEKFSSNWKKAKAKIQKLHSKVANVRNDHLHKVSHIISKNHAVVCIENLQVSNMSASAGGTIEQPGRNVKAKSGLNRSILDQGWGEFRRQLTYKQEWRGGQLIAVPPHNTSRTCPACAHVSADNRKTQERFACVACGFEDNADLVGAINVLAAGHAVLACGEEVQ